MNPVLTNFERFENRHIGPDQHDLERMLETVGAESLDELIDQTVPKSIRLSKPMDLKPAMTESEFLVHASGLAAKNKILKSYIGMGYYNTVTPPVILRNVLENPGWYTQYTPYQAEIAQGRLESLLNFQTMIVDLTGLEIANASLLDEGTAVAEAMHLMHAVHQKGSSDAKIIFADQNIFPQSLDVLQTRADALGIEVLVGDYNMLEWHDGIFGAVLQYPASDGEVRDYRAFCEAAHHHGALVTVACDLLSLCLLTPPGEFGADVAVGSAQRFGVPMGYGGPHAGFFATRDEFKRSMPGRIIGLSIDAQGNPAYRMALQTREQHIRRDKATSNICTAQALLANMAAMYAVYHGPKGLRAIAERVHAMTTLLADGLKEIGLTRNGSQYFDTLSIEINNEATFGAIRREALAAQLNFRYFENHAIGISLDETTTVEDVKHILGVFQRAASKNGKSLNVSTLAGKIDATYPVAFARTSSYLTHPTFNRHHSETEMLRYLKLLENKDFSLAHGMIPLGSCTMKLNATAEMIPVTLPGFGEMHPFAPLDQTAGYQEVFTELESMLRTITGFAAISLQPNAGAQGEYTGLLVIRAYHKSRGESHRDVVLIPASAHGTNPASAVMAGMRVVVIKTDANGNIDLDDLRKKVDENRANLGAFMVTYPSTHGVFEEAIKEICEIIHAAGGQVYMDGANMNAQVGLTSPAAIGADVCHLNLHKTFCIPHGGGGPGVGPIGVAKHLAAFLPGHSVIPIGSEQAIGAVASAPWGSASILLISYAYIAMMGADGLTNATKYAILNANYIQSRLQEKFPVLYKGTHGRVAHEMILDMRGFKALGVEVEDIAKRLMDYGFHAPTLSFPVAGTLMVEPTESEPLEELDRFCEAMIAVHNEIEEIATGKADKTDNVLKNSPHTAESVISDNWQHPYTREKAAYPVKSLRANKFWPATGRVNNAYGDRTLICTCPSIEEYEPATSVETQPEFA
ncbi:MAG: aminomethyl-transferring glycine dehydrogenase [Bacteroidota bacterium]|nr:aminomethyl-transferring glycine dehydrogenase [Bacteroidota bacterium]MDP4233481.1 aminomethyl-transferring glycine dehydrogenase [Bacteroidota bacterium]MDP4243359.1 aminomethyl-transferring glycine dehydrogenase [Bacteroidota bacterium]MDP4287955.1 aminomethyl-transferring glycine dehydrogenase [Bacteroidota bacterium]